MHEIDAYDASEVAIYRPLERPGHRQSIATMHLDHQEDGTIDPDDLESEAAYNIALVLTSPKLLEKAIAALHACGKLIEELASPNMSKAAQAAEESLNQLDRVIDEATDTGWLC